MPYKNPADKRQWEHEHREQRNARRRRQHLGVKIGPMVPGSSPDPTPDPMFQKGVVSALALSAETGPEQRSPLLEVACVVALLAVFFVGFGLVVYFSRADKATTNRQPDPISAKEPKGC